MSKQDIIKEYHDALLAELEPNIIGEISLEWLKECREIVILGTGFPYKIANLLRQLTGVNPELLMHTVVKQEVAEGLAEESDLRYCPIIWSDRFSLAAVDTIRQNVSWEQVDAVFFISRDRIDLRDTNLLEIMQELNGEKAVRVVCYNGNTKVMTEYRNIARIAVILKAYESLMNVVHEVFCVKQ